MRDPLHTVGDKLRPDDVLEREPHLETVTLPDGRVLVRHPRGLSLLSLGRERLDAVLAEVDGQRTAAEVVDALGGAGIPEKEARGILRSLLGDVLHRRTPVAGRVLVVGGDAASRLLAELERAGLTAEGGSGADLEEADLLVVALDETPYRALFELQRRALRRGIPSLFVTADADGVRLGPSVVPGESACFACALLAGFAFLSEDDAPLLEALGGLGGGRFTDAPGTAQAFRAAAGEARALLDPDGGPELLAHVLRFAPGGGVHRYAVLPRPGCPLCGDARAAADPRARLARLEVAERAPTSAEPADELVASVGVVGGGSAGLLAALALKTRFPRLAVTVVASSKLPVIGVGEATTPLLPQFLHADLGFDVHQLFREVRPTLKLGIRFLWGRPGGVFNYPFGPVRPLEALAWDGDLERCSTKSMLMTAGRVPAGEGFSRLDTETAYHLDNVRFVRYLEARVGERGVARVDARIAEVVPSADGEAVEALVTEDGRRLAFDLYVDASGFPALLVEGALGSPFQSWAASLPTDRALVGGAPHPDPRRVVPYTQAETLDAGWLWSTPQADSDHKGYVFASAFLEPGAAEEEMRRQVPGLGEVRLVRFRSGRHEHFWKGNVVALGNAYGFVEPLESTALHMLVRQVGVLLRAFPLRRGERGIQGLVNREVGAAWDYLRFFLALHYKYNRRADTELWRASRDVDLGEGDELVTAFRERGPLAYDRAARLGFDYPDPLWGPEGIDVLLLGQGVPTRLPRPRLEREAWRRRLELVESVVQRSWPQAEALERLAEDPRHLDRLAAAYRAAGPAFPSPLSVLS